MRLREALARPETYPHRPPEVSVGETHISWVFLAGDLVYKLKKPLVLEFLDYGTPERRRAMCEAEVQLNRRLAPEIYLGVRGVILHESEAELTTPDDPRAVDYVVEMRRYEESDTLSARLERGELTEAQVTAVGRVLARFHADAPAVAGLRAPVLAVERRFDQNLQELLARVEQRAEIGRVQALERFAHAFITSHAATLQARAAAGRVREGHGDLRAEHVLVNGEVQIVDCVEFDPALRQLDVSDDLAFLVLDLAARGGEALGRRLVRAYRAAGGDPGPDQLVAFYAAYRALVRAKVGLVRASQLCTGSAGYARESAGARELIAVAESFAWRARLPLVLVMCGVPASGKSHLAKPLADLAGLVHLSSDLTRKRLAGVSSSERAAEDAYSWEWNLRTYAELGRLAAESVQAKGGAIVDATFRHAEDRRAFATALGAGPRVLFIECQAPRAVLAARAVARERDPTRVSDADLEVVLHERARWEPLDEVPGQSHLMVRTDRATEEAIGDVLALLDRRLETG